RTSRTTSNAWVASREWRPEGRGDGVVGSARDGSAYECADEPAAPTRHRSRSGVTQGTASPWTAVLRRPRSPARHAAPGRPPLPPSSGRGLRGRLLLAQLP